MEKISTVQTTELVRTSQSWDGVDLPDYLVGKPEKDCRCRCSIQRYHRNNVTFGGPLATRSTQARNIYLSLPNKHDYEKEDLFCRFNSWWA